MFASLRSRLWLTYALLTLVMLCVVTFGLIFYLIQNPLADRQDYLNLERVAEAAARRPETQQLLRASPDEYASRVDSVADVRVLILSPDQSLLVDSRQVSASGFGSLALRRMEKQRGVAWDQSGHAWLYISRSLDGNTIILATPRRGTLSLLVTRRLRDLFREDILPPFLLTSLIALFLALLLAIWMAGWIAAPLQRIAMAARNVAAGRYEPIRPDGPSEVKKLAESFNEMTWRVRASQQSQRDFLANVSHELKTPLTSIQGFAQAIMDGTARTADELQQAGEIIHSEASRMHRLVLDLLELARFDAGMIELEQAPIAIPELLKDVVARFEPQARLSQVQLSSQADELPEVMGDRDRLAQVLNNLVDNALKFTPAGGEVSLLARNSEGMAEITVSDTGPGIPAEALPRIFERFYQIDPSRRGGSAHGSGMGLAIAREIVQIHGGSLTARNNSPHGSRFVVKIPFPNPNPSVPAQGG